MYIGQILLCGDGDGPITIGLGGEQIGASPCIHSAHCKLLFYIIYQKFNLSEGKNPQQYGIGFKEIWEIDQNQHHEGLAMHTAGWPLDNKTYGGSFVYHAEKSKFL